MNDGHPAITVTYRSSKNPPRCFQFIGLLTNCDAAGVVQWPWYRWYEGIDGQRRNPKPVPAYSLPQEYGWPGLQLRSVKELQGNRRLQSLSEISVEINIVTKLILCFDRILSQERGVWNSCWYLPREQLLPCWFKGSLSMSWQHSFADGIQHERGLQIDSRILWCLRVKAQGLSKGQLLPSWGRTGYFLSSWHCVSRGFDIKICMCWEGALPWTMQPCIQHWSFQICYVYVPLWGGAEFHS